MSGFLSSVSTFLAGDKTEIEKKLDQALSKENWGAPTTLLREIAVATQNPMDYPTIMREVWGSLNHAGKNWRQVFKGLVLLEYLVKFGSERVVDAARDHLFRVRTLTDFTYFESGGDKGTGIREKAKALVELLNDNARVRAEREKARNLKDKFVGVSSAGGPSSTYGSASSSSFGGSSEYGYGDEWQARSSEQRDDSSSGRRPAPAPSGDRADGEPSTFASGTSSGSSSRPRGGGAPASSAAASGVGPHHAGPGRRHISRASEDGGGAPAGSSAASGSPGIGGDDDFSRAFAELDAATNPTPRKARQQQRRQSGSGAPARSGAAAHADFEPFESAPAPVGGGGGGGGGMKVSIRSGVGATAAGSIRALPASSETFDPFASAKTAAGPAAAAPAAPGFADDLFGSPPRPVPAPAPRASAAFDPFAGPTGQPSSAGAAAPTFDPFAATASPSATIAAAYGTSSAIGFAPTSGGFGFQGAAPAAAASAGDGGDFGDFTAAPAARAKDADVDRLVSFDLSGRAAPAPSAGSSAHTGGKTAAMPLKAMAVGTLASGKPVMAAPSGGPAVMGGFASGGAASITAMAAPGLGMGLGPAAGMAHAQGGYGGGMGAGFGPAGYGMGPAGPQYGAAPPGHMGGMGFPGGGGYGQQQPGMYPQQAVGRPFM